MAMFFLGKIYLCDSVSLFLATLLGREWEGMASISLKFVVKLKSQAFVKLCKTVR